MNVILVPSPKPHIYFFLFIISLPPCRSSLSITLAITVAFKWFPTFNSCLPRVVFYIIATRIFLKCKSQWKLNPDTLPCPSRKWFLPALPNSPPITVFLHSLCSTQRPLFCLVTHPAHYKLRSFHSLPHLSRSFCYWLFIWSQVSCTFREAFPDHQI